MEAAKGGVVKHILLAKFKDGIPPDQIEQLIKQYANLVNLIEPMKAFHWYPLSSLFLKSSILLFFPLPFSSCFPPYL